MHRMETTVYAIYLPRNLQEERLYNDIITLMINNHQSYIIIMYVGFIQLEAVHVYIYVHACQYTVKRRVLP